MGEIGLSGFLDILFMWFVVYALLVWSKKTRAASVLTGILIVAGIYLVARQLNMVLAAGLLEKFFDIILIALIVIFQEELRHLFEQIAVWSLRRRIGRKKFQGLSREEVDILVRTLTDLAKDRVGALIVIRGKDLIVRHLEGGIDLGGQLSESLLKSLFDTSSPGHDGAVIIQGNKIIRFSTHLPLSKNLDKILQSGTRHAAALGLSELSDALCLVVSEERGTISIARYGHIESVSDSKKLESVIRGFYDEIHPPMKVTQWEGFLSKNTFEKITGLLLACVIWFVLVYGAKQTYRTFTVPVSYPPLQAGFTIAEVNPEKVYVTLGGPRNSFFFLSPQKIKFEAKPDLKLGLQKVRIYPSDFEFPKNLSMEVLAPQEIQFRIAEAAAAAPKIEAKVQDGILRKVKKVWPLSKDDKAEGDVQPNVGAVAAAVLSSKVFEGQKAKEVSSLENAKPDDVVKYLETKLEGKGVIEPLKPEEKKSNTEEKV